MAGEIDKHPNLTRAGMGAPLKGLQRITTTLHPDLIRQIHQFAADRDIRINEAITFLCENGLKVAPKVPPKVPPKKS